MDQTAPEEYCTAVVVYTLRIHSNLPSPLPLASALQQLSSESLDALIERWRYDRRIVGVEWVHQQLRAIDINARETDRRPGKRGAGAGQSETKAAILAPSREPVAPRTAVSHLYSENVYDGGTCFAKSSQPRIEHDNQLRSNHFSLRPCKK